MIDQSSCNQDYSCVEGLLSELRHRRRRHGAQVARPRKTAKTDGLRRAARPGAGRRSGDAPYNILITGIGGTGVITIGALLGMAAHLEGKGVSVLDMTGMSQKNGAVTSHVRIAAQPGRHPRAAHRHRRGGPDPGLRHADRRRAGRDLEDAARASPWRVINSHEQPPGQFAQHPDWQFPAERDPRADRRIGRRRARTSSMPPGSPPRCWATRSPPTCSCSASPSRRD